MGSLKIYDKSLDFYRRTFSRRLIDGNYAHEIVYYLRQYVTPTSHVLDAGSGPIPLIGNQLNGNEVKVTACDLWADEYNEMFGKATPVIPVEQENMENMKYADESFDVVHCANALDHTDYAEAAIAEMERVCKKGGWIILRHAPDQRDTFGGHHYWNVKLWNGVTVFTRRVTAFIVNRPSYMDGEFIMTVWQKT